MFEECPFCKNVELEVIDENEMFERATDDLNYTDTPWFAVICPAPDGCGASGGFAPTKEKAIEKWNRRKDDGKATA